MTILSTTRNTQSSRPLFLALLLLLCVGAGCSPAAPGCESTFECLESDGVGFVCRENTCTPGCDTAEDCEHVGAGHMCMSDMCMGMDPSGPEVVQPGPTEQDTSLVILTDLDPDPGVFEATLVAAVDDVELVAGKQTSAYVYKESLEHQGTIPGPFIDVVAGTLVRIHFTNHLPEPTTIHWHGLRLPANMDGVPDISQPPIQPGESYTYEYVAQDAALFWYHPHFRSDVQVERGLSGLMVVRSVDEPIVDVERFFTVDDILLDSDGQVEAPDDGPAHFVGEDGNMMMSFTSMMGRHGNRLLLNGKANPIIEVEPGHLERWRLANTANARFFNLSLEGHTFTLIGVDGGLIPNPHEVEQVLVANAERIDVLVRFDQEPATEHFFVTEHYDRGHDLTVRANMPIAMIRYSDAAIDDSTPVPDTARAIETLDAGDTPQHVLTLGESMNFTDNSVDFSINDEVWPDVTPESGQVGDIELWEVRNGTDMDHPFHLHGQFFQVQRRRIFEGTPWVDEEYMHWRDTVDILPGESIQFAVRYDGFPGTWIYHCHIFEHGTNGMMGKLELDE
jgi:FtsP/CotA-like multicopper oxidase with cupredoxin domain